MRLGFFVFLLSVCGVQQALADNVTMSPNHVSLNNSQAMYQIGRALDKNRDMFGYAPMPALFFTTGPVRLEFTGISAPGVGFTGNQFLDSSGVITSSRSWVNDYTSVSCNASYTISITFHVNVDGVDCASLSGAPICKAVSSTTGMGTTAHSNTINIPWGGMSGPNIVHYGVGNTTVGSSGVEMADKTASVNCP